MAAENLEEIVSSTKQNMGAINVADLPSLLDVFDEIRQSIGRSISDWDTKRKKYYDFWFISWRGAIRKKGEKH